MMKIIGFLLIAVGFIAGALASVLDPVQVKWNYFVLCAGIGTVGVLLLRLTHRKHKQSTHVVHANLETVETSLQDIVAHITDLNARKGDINTYDIHRRIDEIFPDDLRDFVAARQGIAYRYGLQAYADVMSAFAAAERYLNRVWSASADGYRDEVNLYLERACDQFKLSLSKIKHLEDRRIVGDFR